MKSRKIKKLQVKLKKIINRAMQENNVEKALMAVNASAHLSYCESRQYTDEFLEQILQEIEQKLPKSKLTGDQLVDKSILFYDGFGLDIRGLAVIYLKALVSLGYKIIYVTVDTARDGQPEIKRLLNRDSTIEYIPWHGKYWDKINCLNALIEQYKPQKAIYYTTPWDVVGVVSFEHYQDIVKRYLINLTDHTFWLGKYAADICIEFRDYGAGISTHYRKMDSSKIAILPFYPYVDYSLPFEGFPFDVGEKKVLFSGGGLYKTIDDEKTYYQLIRILLSKYEDIIFLYAGTGDARDLDILKDEYTDRVYHIDERKDLYQLMKHSFLYLSTYPIAGGLMTQYAAVAGCVPLTLLKGKSNHFSGILLNQDNLGVMFRDINDLLDEFERLYKDAEYMQAKKQEISTGIIHEEQFAHMLQAILLREGSSDSPTYEKEDTSEFLAIYIDKVTRKDCETAILKKDNEGLKWHFPLLYFSKKIRLKRR